MELGRWLLITGPAIAAAMLLYKGFTLGWGGMPPVAPVLVVMLAGTAYLVHVGQVRAGGVFLLLAAILAILFGLSAGFLLWPVLISVVGWTVTAKKPAQVDAS